MSPGVPSLRASRSTLACAVTVPAAAPDAYAVVQSPKVLAAALVAIETLRAGGVRVVMHAGGGSMKSQFRRADASGARHALIFAEDEIDRGEVGWKDLRDTSAAQRALPLATLGARAAELRTA